jgi:hypothetical protein
MCRISATSKVGPCLVGDVFNENGGAVSPPRRAATDEAIDRLGFCNARRFDKVSRVTFQQDGSRLRSQFPPN